MGYLVGEGYLLIVEKALGVRFGLMSWERGRQALILIFYAGPHPHFVGLMAN